MHHPSTNQQAVEFRIDQSSPNASVRILSLHGDVDLHSAPELREVLQGAIAEGARMLIVDLSGTTVIDSTSLGVLLGALKRLREREDGQIRLVVARPEVRRILEITMLDRIFAVYETQDEALADRLERAG
jgi:anti-sigma B factor antagonist